MQSQLVCQDIDKENGKNLCLKVSENSFRSEMNGVKVC